MFKTLRSRIIATYLLVVMISLLLASAVFLFFLSRYVQDRERDDLLRQVEATAAQVSRVNETFEPPPLDEGDIQQRDIRTRPVIGQTLNTQAEVMEAKLFLAAPGGKVIQESRLGPALGEVGVDLPPDIFSEQGPRITERFFEMLEDDYVFATAPAMVGPGDQGFLIAIKPVAELGSAVSSLLWYLALAGAIALGFSMLLALYLSFAVSKPVKEVTEAARRMAAGDYEQEVEVRGYDETAELARDFNLMAERVRTAYERQRDFAGDVSHELRTPLTSIEGFSQAMLDGVTDSEEERRRSLEIINQESKRLVRVLRDLLLLSQIDAGEMVYERRPVDLADLLDRMGSMYRSLAAEKGIQLRVRLPETGEALAVMSDPDGLERVLTNLLDNAMKYTDEGGEVVVSASGSPRTVEVSVADTGCGISPDLQDRIFDRFYRVEKSRATKHGGAGLGLSICKELVEALGGTITVRSLEGEGTTVTIVLPRLERSG